MWKRWLIGIGWVGVIALLWPLVTAAQPEYAVSGVVEDEHGPVSRAVVRVQTTTYAARTGADGTFTLELPGEGPYDLTAWAVGYFCSGPVTASAGEEDVVLTLHAHSSEDNPDYEWLPSLYHPGQGEDQGCAHCHSAVDTALPYTLPVDEWLLDAHSQAAVNERFLTMFLGTDVHGQQSPLTRYATSQDYGDFPLPPDLSQPYYGPGYRLDFPDSNGNCAACHTPAAAINAPYHTDPTGLSGVEAEGIPCDFCHKVWDVELDVATGLPDPNMPGVLSYTFRRPPEGHQFFAGPFDDVAPGEDTFSPVQTESEFCAPCHFGVFWDVVIYNSFGEWQESAYSDPETGQTCQDCHMPALGADHFALPEQGGLRRDPATIASHRMPGAADEPLLQETLTLDLEAEREEDSLSVTAAVTNTGAGHHVPTDSPLRQVLLVITVRGEDGALLAQTAGPTLPAWAGDLAGQPGTYFARILEEVWTEISPTGAYWNPTRELEDTRLPALETAESAYTFAVPEGEAVTVEAVLWFRRAFYDLMQQKDWDVPDILMESETLTVPAN